MVRRARWYGVAYRFNPALVRDDDLDFLEGAKT
jgi:hypothetical protein